MSPIDGYVAAFNNWRLPTRQPARKAKPVRLEGGCLLYVLHKRQEREVTNDYQR